MAHVRKGILIRCQEWAKHLRPYGKRRFWHKHRKVEKRHAEKEKLDR